MYRIKCKKNFKSALASHWHETGHRFEQSNLKLIKSCDNKKNLNMLKAISGNPGSIPADGKFVSNFKWHKSDSCGVLSTPAMSTREVTPGKRPTVNIYRHHYRYLRTK